MGYPIPSFPVGIKRGDRLDGPILPFDLDAPFCSIDLSELQNRLWICIAHVAEYAPRRPMRKPNCLGARRAAGTIEIEFASGARMRLMGPVDASTVKAMITVLAKAQRR
jgi:hypothetical protein